MPELPKYNGTSNPNTTYTCAVKGNNLKDDEIESVLLKKFGETLLKGAMMWYYNLGPNSIDSFAMLADSFIKAHVGAIKVATRKSDVLKIKQRENEMLQEFIYRFQMERIELPPVFDNWAVQAFTQGLNEQSSVASKQLKQNLVEYPAVTWSDIHNRYQSKIRVDDDQLGAPSGSVYPSKLLANEQNPYKKSTSHTPKTRETPRGTTYLAMIEGWTEPRIPRDSSIDPDSTGTQGRRRHLACRNTTSTSTYQTS
ncbi:uncharacterized protein [Nicotiana sylvestris]|uniref:uncharacterized protein n=1 Tax=Nicotiana sylvestris TaxID=4096 RepID=UPI00388CC7E5